MLFWICSREYLLRKSARDKCCFSKKESPSLVATNSGCSSMCSCFYLPSSLPLSLSLSLSGVIFVFRCWSLCLSLFMTLSVSIYTVHVCTQSPCTSHVYISVCTGTDGPGMHHPFCSRVLAWRPPTTDGLNHRPFWVWRIGWIEIVNLLRKVRKWVKWRMNEVV